MEVKEAQEIHGIFQFGDDMFDEPQVKTRHFIDWSYEPQETVAGWMLTDDYSEIFKSSVGPNQLLNAIEYEYFYKRYERALQLCLEWKRLNQETERRIKPFDVDLISARCLVKMNRYQEAIEVVPENAYFFRGEILIELNRFQEAFDCYLSYLKSRPLDYMAFKRLYSLFDKMGYSDWAQICLSICIDLNSPKSLNFFSELNQQFEMAPLKKKLKPLPLQNNLPFRKDSIDLFMSMIKED